VVPPLLLLASIGPMDGYRGGGRGAVYTCHPYGQRSLIEMRVKGSNQTRNAESQPFRIHAGNSAVKGVGRVPPLLLLASTGLVMERKEGEGG
jgi:hypothetical protein